MGTMRPIDADWVAGRARGLNEPGIHICSHCGFVATDHDDDPWSCFGIWNYCPNCGVEMGKEGDEYEAD